MPEAVRANSQWAIRTNESVKGTLAPQAVEGAVMRLCWVCFICVVLIIFSVFLQRRLQPEIAESIKLPAIYLTWLFIALIALALAGLRRFHLLSPPAILNLGLAFEVLVAFGISFSETALPMSPDHPVLDVSKVAVCIALAKSPEDRPQSARERSGLLAAAGVPEWTQERASEWWQTYLPESSSYRMARQSRAAETVSLQEA